MTGVEHFATVAHRLIDQLRPKETDMATTTTKGFGRRNPHCSNCGDERGGMFGHERSECRYRSGMTAEQVAEILPAERQQEFWDLCIDRYLRSQGIGPDASTTA